MAKKLTKQELEQDPLINSYARVNAFYQEHKTTLIVSAIAVVLLIGLSIGYYYYSLTQEREAQQLMTAAEQYYRNANYERALSGSEEEFTVGFEQIINNYGGTNAGNLARYYAAVCEYNLGNLEEALNYVREFDAPDGILGVGPISFHAMVLTDLGRHNEAAEIYVEAAEWDMNESTTPYNYLEAANAYYDAGQYDMARQYARAIVDDYPNSNQVADANRILGLLAARE